VVIPAWESITGFLSSPRCGTQYLFVYKMKKRAVWKEVSGHVSTAGQLQTVDLNCKCGR
jgi:hypothetical protein